MLGAIAGDIIGSIYEHRPIQRKDFLLFQKLSTFTDDTVLTVAIAKAILEGLPYRETVRELAWKYPLVGYGKQFKEWLWTEGRSYDGYGNGSAMRVGPVGFAFDSIDKVLDEARKTAEFTHGHPEGIKGAQATALAVHLARTGAGKEDIRREIATRFGYDLKRTVDGIRPGYHFDSTCQGSVPEAIIAFLDSTSWEDAVRNAVSLGGDSDTQACIAGGIAEAFYGGAPQEVAKEVNQRLPEDLWEVVEDWCVSASPSSKTSLLQTPPTKQPDELSVERVKRSAIKAMSEILYQEALEQWRR